MAAEVRAEIARSGIKQAAVWQRIERNGAPGLSRSTWYRMVKGAESTPFDLDALDATAKALGLSVGDLLSRVDGLDLRARRDSNPQPSDPKVRRMPVAA